MTTELALRTHSSKLKQNCVSMNGNFLNSIVSAGFYIQDGSQFMLMLYAGCAEADCHLFQRPLLGFKSHLIFVIRSFNFSKMFPFFITFQNFKIDIPFSNAKITTTPYNQQMSPGP